MGTRTRHPVCKAALFTREGGMPAAGETSSDSLPKSRRASAQRVHRGWDEAACQLVRSQDWRRRVVTRQSNLGIRLTRLAKSVRSRVRIS